MTSSGRAAGRRRGSALVVVLLSLGLLFSLGVPYLMATRLRQESAAEAFGRAQARVATSSAAAAFAARQEGSHPAADPTPLYDASAEWDGSALGILPQTLGGGWEEATESWGAEMAALQSLLPLGSAPPLLLQNLIHPCFLTRDMTYRDAEVMVSSTEGFPEAGLVLIGGRWLQYAGKTPNRFTGVLADPDPPQNLDDKRFSTGRFVMDPRVWDLALARLQTGEFRAPEFAGDLLDFAVGGDPRSLLPEAERRRLADRGTERSGGLGSADWMPGTWLIEPINPEFPDQAMVADADLFNAGTVLRIQPETGAFLDTVVLAARGQRLLLAQPLPTDLALFTTNFTPLRREPVDVNSCAPELLEALALGVAFQAAPPVASDSPVSGDMGDEWVSPNEARVFAARVLAARPLQGPDDLWLRVLAPLAESGPLSDLDAWALWLNSVDPCNGNLRQSTTSFAYRSGDRYAARISAVIRSRLGRTLARRAEQVRMAVAPDGPLTSFILDQVTLDDAGRWARGAHRVTSLPNHVGRTGAGFTSGINGPTLRLGTLSQPGRVLPEPDPENFALLPEPVFEADSWGANTQGRIEHFDFETSPLGRPIAERGPMAESAAQWNVPLLNGFSQIEPLCLEAWFEARAGLADAVLMDLAGVELRRNRVYAGIEQGELIARAYDAAGDDPLDPDGLLQGWTWRVDLAEYSLINRPFHLNLLLRGVGAGGLQFAVDGVPRGDVDGQDWLSGGPGGYAPGDAGGTINVESTAGFPSAGALQIGNEVIEYSSKTDTAFNLARTSGSGANTYLGGRGAREQSDTLALALDTDHPSGAGARIYGYSAVLAGDVPPGGGSLSGSFGPWSLAVCELGIEDVNIELPDGTPFNAGRGIVGAWTGVLELAPFIAADNYYAEAFQSDGGYAVIWQPAPVWLDGTPVRTVDGSRLGGLEIVHYSQRSGTQLTIDERNVLTPLYANTRDNSVYDPAGNSFVMEWADGLTTSEGVALNEDDLWRVHLMPISVKGRNVSDLAYVPGTPEFSAFVQISTAGDSSITEWVRYDSILRDCFLRDEWQAINDAIGSFYFQDGELNPPRPGGGGGSGGGGGPNGGGSGGGGPGTQPKAAVAPPAMSLGSSWLLQPGADGQYTIQSSLPGPAQRAERAARAARSPRQDPGDEFLFRPTIGEAVDDRDAQIEGILQRLDFRGTMSTFDHAQVTGALLIPVGMTNRGPDAATGFVGRADRVAVMQPQAGDVAPNWYQVEWGQAPFPRARVRNGVTYFAFNAHPGLPYLASIFKELDAADAANDLRNYARLVKFPSGERPLNLESITWGSDLSDGADFDGWVDEASLHTVGGNGPATGGLGRAAFVLNEELSAGEESNLVLSPNHVMVDGYVSYAPSQGAYLQQLPPYGLIDVDGERIAYVEISTQDGRLTLAPNGRGLHGTERRAHAVGARVFAADGRYSSILQGDVAPGEHILPVDDPAPFARGGLLLLDHELVHAPLRPAQGGLLAMPRHRPEPGSSEPGFGVLRGRFGTPVESHGAGTLVHSFPTRWMDGYEPRCADPALTWLELGFEAPGAQWRGLSFEEESADGTQHVRALARSGTARWEDDPLQTPGLVELTKGQTPSGGFVPLGLRDDRLEVRFFFDWEAGSFDPQTFTATGWTQAPRVRRILLDYLAQTRIEKVEEIVE